MRGIALTGRLEALKISEGLSPLFGSQLGIKGANQLISFQNAIDYVIHRNPPPKADGNAPFRILAVNARKRLGDRSPRFSCGLA